MLELRDLVKHHHIGEGEPIRAVDGVSLSVGAGQIAAIYGPSGSGKTTLLELIAAVQRPDDGKVLVEGQDIFAMSQRALEHYRLRKLGVIGHPSNLIPGARAIENASLKLWLTHAKSPKQKIEPLLERLGLADRMRHRTEQLSMGERQRVLIAQALAADPVLILADEPTGSLDTTRTRDVLGLLREVGLERDAAIVLATHDPQAIDFADDVYLLRDGKLERSAPPEVVILPKPSPQL